MRKSIIALFITAALLLIASSVFAGSGPTGFGVYYTYGGFEPTQMAFERIQQIMNFSRSGGKFTSSGYLMMVAAFMVLSAIMAGASGFMKMAGGMQANIFVSLAPILLGFLVFVGLFTPKADLIVFDPVLNRQSQAAMALPVGVVYPACMVNKVERYIIDLLDSTSNPAVVKYTDSSGAQKIYNVPSKNYAECGGDVCMSTFINSMSGFVTGNAASKTMNDYIKNCAMFEMIRPGGTLKQKDLISPPGGKTLMDVLADAQSPANWTLNYMPPAGNAGDVASCTDTYTALVDYYVTNAATNTKSSLENSCAGSGFEPMGYSQCQMMMETMLGTVFPVDAGGSLMPETFVSNMSVANITQGYLRNADPQTGALFQSLSASAEGGAIGGALAGIINSQMLTVYVAYTFFLIPLLAMLLPTPLGQKAISLMLSMVVWVMLVRCLDVILFHMYWAEWNRVVANMGDIGAGLASYFRLPTEASLYLKQIAGLRGMIFLLATAISGFLFKYGDSALSRLADKAHGEQRGYSMDQGQRAKSAFEMQKDASRAATMAALASGAGGFDIGRGAVMAEMDRAMQQVGRMGAMGSVAGVAGATATSTAVTTAQGVSKSMAMGTAGGAGAGAFEAGGNLALQSAFGNDAGAYNKFMQDTHGLSQADRGALQRAANALGMSLAEFAGNRANLDYMKASGMLSANLSNADLQAIGKAGLLSEAGRADAVANIHALTGMDPRQAAAFLGTHEGQMAYAKYANMDDYARKHDHSFMDLAKASQRSFGLDVGAAEAKSWGVRGAGHNAVSVDANGNNVFADQHGGQQYQVGTFGTSGTNIQRVDHNDSSYSRTQTIQSYSQVDKTYTNAGDVGRVNQALAASGSSARVSVGDTVSMRMGPSVAANQTRASGGLATSHGPQGSTSTVSSFDIKRGGERSFTDHTSTKTGSSTQTDYNHTQTRMGVDVKGAGSALIRDVAGQKGAEVIMGTVNGTTATIQNAATILRPLSGGGGGGGGSAQRGAPPPP